MTPEAEQEIRRRVLTEAADRIEGTRNGFPLPVKNGITWAVHRLRRMATEEGDAS